MSSARGNTEFNPYEKGKELQEQMQMPIAEHPTGNTQRPVSTADLAAQMAKGRESMDISISQQKEQMANESMRTSVGNV